MTHDASTMFNKTFHGSASVLSLGASFVGQVGDKANQELRLLDEYSAGEPDGEPGKQSDFSDPMETSHDNQRYEVLA